MDEIATETKPLRVGIRPKDRFEVFKRDGFTCQYCGRKTPVVVLELDHVVPVIAGGDNDPPNLVTSCWECNRGKGAALLDDRAPVPEPHVQAILLLERELQLREYNAVKRQVRERVQDDIVALYDYWEESFSFKPKHYPFANSLQYWVRHLPVEDIKEYIDMATGRWPARPDQAARYLSGIIRNVIHDAEDGSA